MKLLLVLVVLALSGCAVTKELVEVKIPISVPCKTETPVEPSYRFSPPYTKTFDAVRDLLGDREVAQAYEEELRVALKSCK